MKLPEELYENNSSLRIAFADGKLAMCEEIRDIIHHFMAQHNINPFKDNNEFQEGQMSALTAIIQQCSVIEDAQNKADIEPVEYDA